MATLLRMKKPDAEVRRFADKVVAVLGASSGIGAATARRLAAEGATVVLGGVSLDAMRAVAEEINESGGAAEFCPADLYDGDSLSAMVDGIVERHGRIDGLYNNSIDTRVAMLDADALSVDLDVFDQSHRANLRGYLLSSRAALVHMVRQGSGSIVQCSSVAAQWGNPDNVGYQCAKAGVEALTRHIAVHWGRQGIRCNAVVPGVILTEKAQERRQSAEPGAPRFHEADMRRLTPFPRLGTSEDVAGAVTFLLSDDSPYVNGQTLVIDGGMGIAIPPLLANHLP